MLPKVLPYMRCTKCLSAELHSECDGLLCRSCMSRFPIRNSIVDMAGQDPDEMITPFQRIMQTPAVVSVYEKFWRRIGYFLASSRSFGKEMKTVLGIGGNKNTGLALDLACGTGVFTRPLAKQGGLVIGLDLSWPMLKYAQREMEKDGPRNILFVRATAFCIPFVDETFSHVNCCGALHLFSRTDAALKEIRRVLRPGGYFSAQTTIRPNYSAGFAYVLEKFIRFGFFNEKELREKVAREGFSFIESERHRISFTFLARRS
jgi:ubiquinone/menaquinone biosynthesis C-methylase UbiE